MTNATSNGHGCSRRMAILRTCLLVLGCVVIFLTGCSRRTGVQSTKKQREVEVSPGQWVTVEVGNREVVVDGNSPLAPPVSFGFGDTDQSMLAIPWQGRTVSWHGYPITFTLREWGGKLYIIGFDRTDMKKVRFRYYRQQGDRFAEIQPAEFPKRVATQNMWLDPNENVRDANGRPVFELLGLRELDVNYPGFVGGLTAYVWRHISTGQDYYQTHGHSDDTTVREYKLKYDPIALPTIIRMPEGWPDNVAATRDEKAAE